MRFLRDLLQMALHADKSCQALVLSRFEAIAQRWGYSLVLSAQWEPNPETMLLDSRIGRNPPPDYRDPGSPVRQELMKELAALMRSGGADIRRSVIRILGKSKAKHHIAEIRGYLADAQVPVRIEAIRALSELADMQSADRFIEIAQSGELSERKAAIEGLARLKLSQSVSALIRLSVDEGAGIREVATIALREAGGEEADAALVQLAKSPDKRVRKIAAHAVYWNTRPQPIRHETFPTKWEKMVSGAHAGTYDSLLPVFFLMLPEIRPYPEEELSQRIAKVCADYAGARRKMISFNFMTRAYTPGEGHIYELTEMGKTIWRVENHIRQCLERPVA